MDKNTNSQDFWEFWRMRRQCVLGSLSPPPESEPGFEASGTQTARCCEQPRFKVVVEALLGILFNQGLTGGEVDNWD